MATSRKAQSILMNQSLKDTKPAIVIVHEGPLQYCSSTADTYQSHHVILTSDSTLNIYNTNEDSKEAIESINLMIYPEIQCSKLASNDCRFDLRQSISNNETIDTKRHHKFKSDSENDYKTWIKYIKQYQSASSSDDVVTPNKKKQNIEIKIESSSISAHGQYQQICQTSIPKRQSSSVIVLEGYLQFCSHPSPSYQKHYVTLSSDRILNVYNSKESTTTAIHSIELWDYNRTVSNNHRIDVTTTPYSHQYSFETHTRWRFKASSEIEHKKWVKYIEHYQSSQISDHVFIAKEDKIHRGEIVFYNKVQESSISTTLSIQHCTVSQLITLLQTHEKFNDPKINSYKPQIVKYIQDHDINGHMLLNTKQKDFSQSLVDLYNDKKMRGAADKTYARFQKFDTNISSSLFPSVTGQIYGNEDKVNEVAQSQSKHQDPLIVPFKYIRARTSSQSTVFAQNYQEFDEILENITSHEYTDEINHFQSTPFALIFQIYDVKEYENLKAFVELELIKQCDYLRNERIWNKSAREKLINDILTIQQITLHHHLISSVEHSLRSFYQHAQILKDLYDVREWDSNDFITSFIWYLIETPATKTATHRTTWEFVYHLRKYFMEADFNAETFLADTRPDQGCGKVILMSVCRKYALSSSRFTKVETELRIWRLGLHEALREIKTVTDSIKSPIIDQSSPPHVLYIINNHPIFDHEIINPWKPQILQYIKEYNVDGHILLTTERQKWCKSLVELYSDEIRAAAHITHVRFTKCQFTNKWIAELSKDKAIEYVSGSIKDKGVLINVNLKQGTIIIQRSTGIYECHKLKHIKITVPSIRQMPAPSLPIIPHKLKDDPFKRIDYGLQLYYQQIGRNDYKIKDDNGTMMGRFMAHVQASSSATISKDGFLADINQGKISNLAQFDDSLFEGQKQRDKKIFNLIAHCYEYGYPEGNIYYDPIEVIMANHKIIQQDLIDKISQLNKKCLSLHKWRVEDVANTIHHWILSDIKHLKYLRRTMKMFELAGLSGNDIVKMESGQEASIIKSKLDRTLSETDISVPEKLGMTKGTYDKMIKFLLKSKTDQDYEKSARHEKIFNISQQELKIQSALELGYSSYNAPINNLLLSIKKNKINGEKLMNDGIAISTQTGWDSNEVMQLEAVLYRNSTFRRTEFMENMDDIMSKLILPIEIRDEIKATIADRRFDVEEIHFRIKHNKEINHFRDEIINLIHKLEEENEVQNLTKQCYEAIADFFIIPYNSAEPTRFKRHEWRCSNCGNYNFLCRIDSKDIKQIKKCRLCGISHQQSIIWKIRGHPTFVDINHEEQNIDEEEKIDSMIDKYGDADRIEINIDNEQLPGTIRWVGKCERFGDGIWYGIQLDEKHNEHGHDGHYKGQQHFRCEHGFGIYIEEEKIATFSIDALIKKVYKRNGYDLYCPNRHDIKICPSIWRLCRSLIHYKRWIQTVCEENNGHDDIQHTIQVNIDKYIDDDAYKKIFIECSKNIKKDKDFTNQHLEALKHMVDHKYGDIDKISKFMSFKDENVFASFIKTHTAKILATKGSSTDDEKKSKESSNDHNTIPKWNQQSKVEQIIKVLSYAISTSGNTILTQNRDKLIECFVKFGMDGFKMSTITRKEFGEIIVNHTGNKKVKGHSMKILKVFQDDKCRDFITAIKPSVSTNLYKTIMVSLKQEAQTKQFGIFLSNVELTRLDHDYHHILRDHIHGGNKVTIRNVFSFFEDTLHYDDPSGYANENCRSIQRRQKIKEEVAKSSVINNDQSDHRIKDIWKVKQYHVQNQLDIYHSYLCHSNWKYFVKLQQEQDLEDVEDIKENEEKENLKASKLNSADREKNTEKYTSKSNDLFEYGFGIEHQHPHLKPKHDSIYDELLMNEYCPINEDICKQSLVKAIKKHAVATGDHYGKTLICKNYDKEYNIIRNSPIGIRHIFALLLYTDNSQLCTAYRQTYRIMNKKETCKDVAKRHRQFYHLSRALYESIEFYGEYLAQNDKLYHGLDKIMRFKQFYAYFNQPISTTPSYTKAKEFSRGVGIILTLKSGASNKVHPPKFFHVSWLSDFPEEEEKLFYGSHVVFEIHDIIEAQSNTKHFNELKLLNKFQRLLNNQAVDWKHSPEMVAALNALIRHKITQQNDDMGGITDDDDKDHTNPYLSRFGRILFKYFCDQKTSIIINDYLGILATIKYTLFGSQSWIERFVLLLPRMQELTLTNIDVTDLTAKAKEYMNSVKEFVMDTKKESVLEMIQFKTKSSRDRTTSNTTLEQLQMRDTFRYTNWRGSYKWNQIDNTHSLIFETIKYERRRAMDKSKYEKQPNLKFHQMNADILPCFMQILSIEAESFCAIVSLPNTNSQEKRVYCIKQTGSKPGLDSSVHHLTLFPGETSKSIDIRVHPDYLHHPYYNLSIYENSKANIPLSNSSQIQLKVPEDEEGKLLLPDKTQYRPQQIQGVCCFKDSKNEQIAVYWAAPSLSYGDISYEVIMIEENETKTVKSLPFCASLPMLIQVVTVAIIADVVYKSEPSETFVIKEPIPEGSAFTAIEAWIAKISETNLDTVIQFLLTQGYDTDALRMDLELEQNSEIISSNLIEILQNNSTSSKTIQSQQDCEKDIKNLRLLRRNDEVLNPDRTFSCGYSFFYWSWFGIPRIGRLDEFGGYLSSELYVDKGTHSTLKDEIMSKGVLWVGQWNEEVFNKAKTCISSINARNMKFTGDGWGKHFGIDDGTPISIEHLMAVILFCDFQDLYKEFASSFHKKYVLEPIESIKLRNKKYYWMSKLLIECVIGYGYFDENEVVYCDKHTLRHVPSFDMTLRGPVLTSTHVEVCKMNAPGIILELKGNAKRFDTRWISRYPEKEMRIFITGQSSMKLMSVRTMKEQKSDQKYFRILYQIDAACNGRVLQDIKPTMEDTTILQDLLSNDKGISEYVINCFRCWTLQRRIMYFDLFHFRNYPSYIKELIMDKVDSSDSLKTKDIEIDGSDFTIRLEFISLFPNLTKIDIYSSSIEEIKDSKDAVDEEKKTDSKISEDENAQQVAIRSLYFSLIRIHVSILFESNLQIIWIRAIRDDSKDKYKNNKDFGSSWITKLWSSSSNIIINMYDKIGFEISVLEPMKVGDGYIEDVIEIKRRL